MSVVLMPNCAVRMNYTTTLLSPSSPNSSSSKASSIVLHHTHELDYEHDQKSPRTRSTSHEIHQEIMNEVREEEKLKRQVKEIRIEETIRIINKEYIMGVDET